MKKVILFFLIIICVISEVSAQENTCIEGELIIKVINLPINTVTNVAFSADLYSALKWAPQKYLIDGVYAHGRLIQDTSFDHVISEKNVYYWDGADVFITFDTEYDESSISTALGKYKISCTIGNSYFIWNTINCGDFADNQVTYDWQNDNFYYGHINVPDSTLLIKNGTTINSWGGMQVTDCLELYLKIEESNMHPKLIWNPYHNLDNLISYEIFKKKRNNTHSLITIINKNITNYIDYSESLYEGYGKSITAGYFIKANLNELETLKSNTTYIKVMQQINKSVTPPAEA